MYCEDHRTHARMKDRVREHAERQAMGEEDHRSRIVEDSLKASDLVESISRSEARELGQMQVWTNDNGDRTCATGNPSQPSTHRRKRRLKETWRLIIVAGAPRNSAGQSRFTTRRATDEDAARGAGLCVVKGRMVGEFISEELYPGGAWH